MFLNDEKLRRCISNNENNSYSNRTTTIASSTGKTKLKSDCVKNIIFWIDFFKTMFRNKIHLLFKVV